MVVTGYLLKPKIIVRVEVCETPVGQFRSDHGTSRTFVWSVLNLLESLIVFSGTIWSGGERSRNT